MIRHPLGYWAVTLARAAAALLVGLVITFTADHSPPVGFAAIAALSLASSVIIAIAVIASTLSGPSRWFFAAEAVVLVVGGLAAVLLRDHGTSLLLFLGCAVFGLSGIIELVAGLVEKTNPARRDWTFAGALSALLAVVALLIPTGFDQHFTGPDGVARALTASVVFVGALGAYAVILGVYLAIGGLSQFWARNTQNSVERANG